VLTSVGFLLDGYAFAVTMITTVSSGVWFGVAGFIAWRKSTDYMALLAALTLILVGAFSITGGIASYPTSLKWSLHVVNGLELIAFFVFLGLFPNGRFVPRWTGWVALGGGVALILDPVLAGGRDLGPFWFVFAATLVGAQIYRYLRVSGTVERQQTKWVIYSVALILCVALGMFFMTQVRPPPEPFGTLMGALLGPTANVVLLVLPLSLGVAILRYRLWDIDPIINRTLVYGALTVSIVGLYVLVVGGLGTLFQARGTFLSLLVTGLIAVLFAPLRDRLQRGVNRLMYGERDDPYAVVSRLGQRLEGTLEPTAVLPTVVQTVRDALKLPYVAVSLGNEKVVAATGTPTGNLLKLPLIYQGLEVGALWVAPRAEGEGLSKADAQLLSELARQIGVAAHAASLTHDLQRSRERLVTAREEERRRLRRDLHDGLGPQLASQSLKLEAARDFLHAEPARAEALLDDLITQSQGLVADIRRLVYALRPPALDDLGLLSALREHLIRAAPPGLRVHLELPERLPPLPAAAEVAAYRIAQEAVTNVVRHARAQGCSLKLWLERCGTRGTLHLEVRDDGVGIPLGAPKGVGLTSMRERAEEVGGCLLVEAATPHGTRIRAALPYGLETDGKA